MNTLNTAGELAGNIKLDLEGGGMMPMMMMQGQNMLNGVLPDQPQSKNRSTLPPEFRNLDTLDEPVCETIVCTNQPLSYAIEKRSGENLVQATRRDQPSHSHFQRRQTERNQKL